MDPRPLAGAKRGKIARPVEGKRAYPRWYQRLAALFGLAGMAGLFGVLLALAVGAVAFTAAALIDYAISR